MTAHLPALGRRTLLLGLGAAITLPRLDFGAESTAS